VFTPDGRAVLVGRLGGAVEVLDAETGRTAGPALVPGGGIESVAVSPDGKTALVGAGTGVHRVDLATRKTISTWAVSGGVRQAWFYPAGDRALVTAGDFFHHRELGHAAAPELPRFHPEGGIDRVAISPDGSYVIVSTSTDRSTRVWDVATGKPLGPPQGWGGARPVAVAPDGRWVAVGDIFGRATIWSPPKPIEGEPGQLTLRVQALTGLELDAMGVIRALSREALAERRRACDNFILN
jgi:WD40 repeat protein